jgi:hypothetical protein
VKGCEICNESRCLDEKSLGGVPQHEILQELNTLEDYSESRTGANAQVPFSSKEEDGISFNKNSVRDEAGVLTNEFAINAEKPHFSFEFEYKTRGNSFLWASKAQLDKSMPSILPYREQWKINGPTVIEFEADPTGDFFSVNVNNKKFDVQSPAEANSLNQDAAAIQFADGFIVAQQWANDKATEVGKLAANFKKSTGGFQRYRVYINPENSLVIVQTTFTGANTLRIAFPENFFAERRYISLSTTVDQTIKIRDISIRAVNEYSMSKQVPWLKKRDIWKLNDKVSVFEFEADNRDCYFVCHPNSNWPINANDGAFVIFYGWDNTKSIIAQDGKEVANNGHRLPEFKQGLFYGYKITIDATSSVLTATSSAGLAMSHSFPAGYFRDKPFCTFGVWGGMEGLTVRNIRRDGKESGVNTRERKGLKVGLITQGSKTVYELLSPRTWLPANEWVRISIRFSTKELIAVPELKTESA